MGLWTRGKRKTPGPSLTVLNDRVVIERDGVSQSIRDEDLTRVAIETTDQGPFVDDMFFHLATPDGVTLVPSQTSGAELLLEHLQGLPGFDSEAVIAAAGSTANQLFVCWQRT